MQDTVNNMFACKERGVVYGLRRIFLWSEDKKTVSNPTTTSTETKQDQLLKLFSLVFKELPNFKIGTPRMTVFQSATIHSMLQ